MTKDAYKAEEHNEEEYSEPIITGIRQAPEEYRQEAQGETFLFTAAQANTRLNDDFWAVLDTIRKDLGASLHVSRFTYNKSTHGKKSVKPGSIKSSDYEDQWFDPRIDPFVSDESLQITPDLVWFGDFNIIPTRIDPISGFENHGRGASIIIPHTRMSMRSIATMKELPARFAYTTGVVTERNYIEKAAGQRATLHHVYGALLVQKGKDGAWYAFQLNADSEGRVYWLDKCWWLEGGQVRKSQNNRVRAIVHGDIHGYKANRAILEVASSMCKTLKPEHQMFHDTIDFMPRNHHNMDDPHHMHDMMVKGRESVESEFDFAASLISQYFDYGFSKKHIIESNHDMAIERWLRDRRGYFDPHNMEFWLKANLYCVRKRKAGRAPRPFAKYMYDALSSYGVRSATVVSESSSLIIDEVEQALHGHLGPRGARGNPKNLRIVGKANTAHTHEAGIVDGVYTAGVYGNLDMGYNKGLGGWSHSCIIQYPNGKRTICTIKGNRPWRE